MRARPRVGLGCGSFLIIGLRSWSCESELGLLLRRRSWSFGEVHSSCSSRLYSIGEGNGTVSKMRICQTWQGRIINDRRVSIEARNGHVEHVRDEYVAIGGGRVGIE